MIPHLLLSLQLEIKGKQEKSASLFIHYIIKMIDKNNIIEIVDEYLKDSSSFLIDVTILPGNVIQVEIDDDDSISIDKCAELSRHVECNLDRETEDFELTVSSAGLTSPLKTVRQYKKFEGKDVEVLTTKGDKIKGILKSSNDEGFSVSTIKKVKLEGAKRKTDVEEIIHFKYPEVKYTKYLINFK